MTAATRRSALRLGLVLVLTATSTALALTVPMPRAEAYPTPNVDLTGHGYGHGRGMGQWGSYGYATNEGWNHRQILTHFYGGTTQSQQSNDLITVRLTWLDGRDLVVTSGRNFTVGGVPVSAGSAARLQTRSDGTFRLTTRYSCTGGDVWETVVSSSQVVSSVANPGNDLNAMLSACTGGDATQYRGELKLVSDGGAQRSVNVLRMEDYLRGVVPRESPPSWADVEGGANALRAQAVAARSYAFSESRYSYAKTCDTTSCQVYSGAGDNGRSVEDSRTDSAISATAGEVLRDGTGRIVRAEFSSSTGGWSAGGQFPAVRDDGDVASPYHNWTASIPVSSIESAYGVGTLLDFEVTRRNGLGADGGRALEVRITGSTRTVLTTGEDVRSRFGLRSDWFTPADVAPPPPPAVQPVLYLRNSNSYGQPSVTFAYGAAGDVPLFCDWDGDGRDTVGVFRDGTFYLRNSNSSGVGQITVRFGDPGGQPVCGDWDGDGVDTIGVFRDGVFSLRNSNTAGPANGRVVFGGPGDTALAGDWNGDPYDTPGIWRAGVFHLTNSNIVPTTDVVLAYGARTDTPLAGDWDGNGRDSIGVARSGTFYLRNALTSGQPDLQWAYGGRYDLPVDGDYDGNGTDTIGVGRYY